MTYHSDTFYIENAIIYLTIDYQDESGIAIYASIERNNLLIHHKISFIKEKMLNYMHIFDTKTLFVTMIKKYFAAQESTKNFENMFMNEILNLFRDYKLLLNTQFISILEVKFVKFEEQNILISGL